MRAIRATCPRGSSPAPPAITCQRPQTFHQRRSNSWEPEANISTTSGPLSRAWTTAGGAVDTGRPDAGVAGVVGGEGVPEHERPAHRHQLARLHDDRRSAPPQGSAVWFCPPGTTPNDWIESKLIEAKRRLFGPRVVRLAFQSPFPYETFKTRRVRPRCARRPAVREQMDPESEDATSGETRPISGRPRGRSR